MNELLDQVRKMPVTGMVPELLTTSEAAQLAGVGERTWWRWTRSGIAPPPLKIGRGLRPAVRFRRSEVLAWMAGGCLECAPAISH